MFNGAEWMFGQYNADNIITGISVNVTCDCSWNITGILRFNVGNVIVRTLVNFKTVYTI